MELEYVKKFKGCNGFWLWTGYFANPASAKILAGFWQDLQNCTAFCQFWNILLDDAIVLFGLLRISQ